VAKRLNQPGPLAGWLITDPGRLTKTRRREEQHTDEPREKEKNSKLPGVLLFVLHREIHGFPPITVT
jgi:hypothetical protein